MSYELSIVRGGSWGDNGEHPITKEEWDAAVAGNPQLMETLRDGGIRLAFVQGEVAVWGEGVGTVIMTDVARLAAYLGARLFGEDGEEYLPDGSVIQSAWYLEHGG